MKNLSYEDWFRLSRCFDAYTISANAQDNRIYEWLMARISEAKNQKRYTVVITGREVTSAAGRVMVAENERFWLVSEEWIDASSQPVGEDDARAPPRLKVFGTREEAADFMTGWQPHPWWVRVKSWKIVRVVPLHDAVTGYEVAP